MVGLFLGVGPEMVLGPVQAVHVIGLGSGERARRLGHAVIRALAVGALNDFVGRVGQAARVRHDRRLLQDVGGAVGDPVGQMLAPLRSGKSKNGKRARRPFFRGRDMGVVSLKVGRRGFSSRGRFAGLQFHNEEESCQPVLQIMPAERAWH